jgi:hypothetical protein
MTYDQRRGVVNQTGRVGNLKRDVGSCAHKETFLDSRMDSPLARLTFQV